jgi:hypothetical protein
MITYLSQLRETLVECFTSIVHGVELSGEKECKKYIGFPWINF